MPPNPRNLKPWPKGKSGNPKGRPPKGRAFEDLAALIDDTPGALRAISKMWLKQILSGNFSYFREYLDRSDGKPVSLIEETDENEAKSLGILVRVPTVKQAEKRERAKQRKKLASEKKPAKGAADVPGPG
jgi:hypothetical protein